MPPLRLLDFFLRVWYFKKKGKNGVCKVKNIKTIICLLLAMLMLFGFVGCAGRETRLDLENIAYGEDEQQSFDLFLPAGKEKDVPLIVLIHGGEWMHGDKSTYTQTARDYCDQFGVAAATIGYRFLSETTAMDALTADIGASIEKICQTAKENGVRITKVALSGHSSGGHLALLYAYAFADTCPVPVAFVCSLSGPSDLTDDNFFAPNIILGKDKVEMLFSYAIGKDYSYETRKDFETEVKAGSPLFHVNENTVPTLVQHGAKDSIIPYSNAVSLDAKLTEYGVAHDFVTFPNSNHGLERDPDCTAAAEELFAEYVSKYLFEE